MRRFGPLALAAALACLWPGAAAAADQTTPTPEQIDQEIRELIRLGAR